MDMKRAIEMANEKYPDMILRSCLETEDLYIFDRYKKGEPTYADSSSIVVDKNSGECSTVNFRKLLDKKPINITYF